MKKAKYLDGHVSDLEAKFVDINLKALTGFLHEKNFEDWKVTPVDGRAICDALTEGGLQLTTASLAPANTLGAWIMDCAWTEAMCRLNIHATDIDYKAVPNEVYTAIPMGWPPSAEIYADIPNRSPVNTGNT